MAAIGGRISKPSCNEILPRLYLGDISVAINPVELTHLGITDMITIEIKPLPQDVLAPCIERYLFINVMDHPKQDILSHFNASNTFIENALKNPSNKVFVHCVAGISRSASLVIAYIMKTRSMTYGEAHDMVLQRRKVIDPNEGFVRQLTLYHQMRYTIDFSNTDYRRMVLDALVFEFRLLALSYYQANSKSPTHKSGAGGPSGMGTDGGSSSGHISSMIVGTLNVIQMPNQAHKKMATKNSISVLFDQYYNKLHLQEVFKYPQVYNPRSAFKCNKCRTVVFYAISVIENKITETNSVKGINLEAVGSSSVSSMAGKTILEYISSKSDQNKDCPYIFIEPQPWMSKSILDRDGKLRCYKCKRKLGVFDWTSNENCSCARHNSHINFNLFKIMRKKIDPGLD